MRRGSTAKPPSPDRASSSLDWMPPARVIAGPRALLTSILLVTRVPCRGSGGWGRTLAHNQRLAPVGRSQVPPSTFHASPTSAAWSSRRLCASTGGRNNREEKSAMTSGGVPHLPHPHVVMPDRDVVATPKCALRDFEPCDGLPPRCRIDGISRLQYNSHMLFGAPDPRVE
jgi:hypothetical protein